MQLLLVVTTHNMQFAVAPGAAAVLSALSVSEAGRSCYILCSICIRSLWYHPGYAHGTVVAIACLCLPCMTHSHTMHQIQV